VSAENHATAIAEGGSIPKLLSLLEVSQNGLDVEAARALAALTVSGIV